MINENCETRATLSVPETPRSPADLVIRGRRYGGMIDWWR
jgi:hypothetical protein